MAVFIRLGDVEEKYEDNDGTLELGNFQLHSAPDKNYKHVMCEGFLNTTSTHFV